MPVTNDLTVYRGQDATLAFTEASGPITNWTIVLTITRSRNNATKLATISASIVDAAAGTYEILIPAATLNIEPGAYAYDVWRTDTGELVPLSIGKLTIKPDSYRPVS